MSRTCCDAEGDNSVGPIFLSDLAVILPRISGATDEVVGGYGFQHWRRDAMMPEVAPCLIKPPPLPP